MKQDTVKKAINSGRIVLPDREEEAVEVITKSERNIIDDSQAMGKACSNVRERVLSALSRIRCRVVGLQDQIDLQHGGSLNTNSIEEKKMEKYLTDKQKLKEEIEELDREIEQVKQQRNAVPYKIPYSELPENAQFENVVNDRKHFLDTIKILAYRAETALAKSSICRIRMRQSFCSNKSIKQLPIYLWTIKAPH